MPRVAAIFEDEHGEWRWHVKAANGEIVAEGESYTRREDAVRGLNDARVEYDSVEGEH